MGIVQDFLADDHRRLERLLEKAKSGAPIDAKSYWEFRGGLLRHISMEEKVLLPAAQAAMGGTALPEAATLRRDHGALAGLLVLPPTHAIIRAIETILGKHNAVEEGPHGVYAQCEQIQGFDSAAVLARLQFVPEVSMNEYADNETAINSAHNAVKRAGYDLKF